MGGRDPIELLRELARAQCAASQSVTDAEQVLDRLGRGTRGGRFRAWLRRRRPWVAGIIAVLVGAGGGTVAWAIVHRERASDPTFVYCYIDPTLTGSAFAVAADGTDPAALCAASWPADDPELGPMQEPLVACKGTDGAAAVFPGSEALCQALGLTALDPSLSEQDQALVAFRTQLAETLTALGCVSPDEVARLATQTAADVGLDGWTMTVEKPTVTEPCGRFGVDPEARVIYIQVLPDLFGGDEGG